MYNGDSGSNIYTFDNLYNFCNEQKIENQNSGKDDEMDTFGLSLNRADSRSQEYWEKNTETNEEGEQIRIIENNRDNKWMDENNEEYDFDSDESGDNRSNEIDQNKVVIDDSKDTNVLKQSSKQYQDFDHVDEAEIYVSEDDDDGVHL